MKFSSEMNQVDVLDCIVNAEICGYHYFSRKKCMPKIFFKILDYVMFFIVKAVMGILILAF